ncbi:DUF4247 domain-containing protein [Corynebacterium uberis]|uniref:DUF4247 domain-containing protein n=1 Tax=Corynebacterium TaxID=1716 RepID=UPI001D09AF0E|nr:MULTISPECIES: DUF4247 domain-containing protein [Corynebacterium]MCZ9309745.1 DUF4247 domain-containing protein [Corynebacterium sp. c6VSa_13]UDL73548.1 DUF4247 domain-containing protein [Corynebacterium uberis]UDL75572.1 DUF4247 domain-containing protein [Corynebacterium uberis]UDL77785.1 DUF4247 domain-containing protein [Corynebacterium uberis]UDL80068.1 DUF4247 domain-containing protein [Corynebacterium uberis]
MSSRGNYVLALLLALLAVLFLMIGCGSGSGDRQQERSADQVTGQCTHPESAEASADDVEQRLGTPQARATDDATGDIYLRYSRFIIRVHAAGGTCQVTKEDLGRVHNGGLIFLGPGFSPSSPSGSSGGSSGSRGGVK